MRAPGFIRRSVKRKTMAIVIVTAFAALLANALALLVYDIRTFRKAELDDIRSQAQVLARLAAPALAFNDRKDAIAGLATLKSRRDLLAAGVYGADGRLFAFFEPRPGSRERLPELAPAESVSASGDFLRAAVPVVEAGQRLGSVYLVTQYGLADRVLAYASILGAVLAIGLGAALLISSRLQRMLTQPIVDIEAAARRVVEQGDFGVRAPRTTEDEIGVLAEGFNAMLAEIQRRTMALQFEMAERLQAEKALRMADKRKDEFLATLAHELRNPMAPIRTSVQLMKMKAPADRDVRWACEVADRQITHLTRLLDDLLDVGRITSNKLALQKARTQLHLVVDSALETSRPMIDAGRHALSVDFAQLPLWVEADPVRLAQALSNLLINAAKYTAPGGRIALRVAADAGRARIAVSDNGIGISAEALPHVFDMFAQDRSALERSQGGLGIGLYLVKQLVELHGGSVSAASAGIGKGSEFTVLLPLAAPAAPGASEASLPARPSGERTILIVDDNVDAASTLSALLKSVGFKVAVENSGAAGFAAAKALAPDAALLDIGMPDMDGYELSRRIRSEPWGAKMLLIAVTGWGQEDDKRRALDAGFDHHVTKPVDAVQLEKLLAQALP
ncbi:MAG TPA: ATP-binding protein [Burkholderiales bacterium]|nr:ATP-binding protein [Burkholderiales bacterium]